MLIGEVAAALGVHRQTIRFYEKQGLVPSPPRQPNGYRDYDPAVISRLSFIQSGQAAGLTLAEITSVLALRDAGQAPCSHTSFLLDRKLKDVQARQLELAVLATELKRLIDASHGRDPVECEEADICNIITNPEYTAEEKHRNGKAASPSR
ncbi:MerR family mercuric resistance operon transcriptional regulator [Cryobacterium sp. CAN_C3]|uniref:heavy metal-responsive transcriptional regulator n=1 Tax=unclassified Cryobacterium TaxID=2649013 RepID=UPI0018CB69F9|nr:heavy metal-responsive transcriptional regulator [Cryobacterium sp. CAN_C3]MEC5155928.1 MerR family mercuric resistance operon transcriptional regulator [Cryobacterium sp. CAN_C3]